MSHIVRQLKIELQDVPVGLLTLDDRGGCSFSMSEAYRQMYPRPVLGQQFEDDDGRKPRYARTRLPSWFANLLPEGGLRQLMERHHGHQEFELLARLGQDLTGAVRATEVSHENAEVVPTEVLAESGTNDAVQRDVWHFSLAGEQMKFSASQSDRGMVIPVSGQGGNWIVKLPHPRYPNVPEIEFATMQWAQATGIQVPETKLIDLDEVDGLPLESFSHVEKVAYAIRRFDRQQSGLRVHMEDFAQILGLYPERKYEKCNYETLAKLVWVMAGDDGLKEMILRFVFMLASGNGDAHLKNWSLLYPDGLLAKLSPAYDLVSTIQYHDDNLALNFGKSKRWVDMRLDTFQRLAIKIECNESRLMEWTQEAVAATRDAWHTSGNDFGYDASARARIGRHMARVPLFSQV
mgnify:CR=1 FL=1